MDEYKHSSKASGATPAGALTRPHGGNFTHSRIEIPCRGGTHPYAFGHPLREGEGDFIALCKQRLQRDTGSKPSKSTNTLPPAWQFSLSWGGASAGEEHRVLGWHGGQAARDARNSPQTARVQRDALLASPSSLVVMSAKDLVLFIGAHSSPRQGKLPRRCQRVCTFRRLRAGNPL